MSTSSSDPGAMPANDRMRRSGASERATWIVAGVSLAVALVCTALASPADARRRKPPEVEWGPTLPPAPLAAPAANGAIFQVAQGYAPLTSGTRAAQVGDVLTIALVERTFATKQATLATDRSGNIGLTPPTTGPLDFIRKTDVSLGGGATSNGKGAATQSNALTGEITVTVAQVYPNGTMLVRGEKALTLNRGDEHVRIAGLVRPSDIGPDNRVASTRVADAKITYTGNGEVARASRQGWLSRFFSVVSPF